MTISITDSFMVRRGSMLGLPPQNNMIRPEDFQILLPLACAWAEEQEKLILQDGVPLTQPQVADAKRAGVSHPGRVRLLNVPRVPMPEHPALRAAAEATQLISPRTGGLTLRYGIFVRSDCWGNRQLRNRATIT